MKELLPNLAKYKIILGSNSPRRRELLEGLDLVFEVKVMPGIDESYPSNLEAGEIPLFIAREKAEAYRSLMRDNELLITADTIVWTGCKVLGKPKGREEAIDMLQQLSGKSHEVITGVCIRSLEKEVAFSVVSSVSFAELEENEIEYYIDKYKPFDKAGSYGVQEWIGYVGVEGLSGSFYNVMGLPVHKLYRELKKF